MLYSHVDPTVFRKMSEVVRLAIIRHSAQGVLFTLLLECSTHPQ